MTGYAQAVIDPLLSEEMNRRNDDEQLKVIVIMNSRYDRTQLNRRADYFVSRAERREETFAFRDGTQRHGVGSYHLVDGQCLVF